MLRTTLLACLIISPFSAGLACSSTIENPDGDGSGAGSSTDTSATGTSTGSNATSTQNSSSTGAGNTCEQGCAHVEDCIMFDGCGQVGIDCTNPNYECAGQCLLDASCADIIALAQQNPPPSLQGCLSACQGGGQGGGSTQQQCGTCLFQSGCLAGCQGDPDCQAWGGCAINCDTPACYAACNAANPSAQTAYEAIYACACTNCSTDCGAMMDPCNQMGGGGGLPGTGGAGGAGSTGSGIGGAGGN